MRNGIADATPALDRSVTCDVAVVGAGITGALVTEEMSAAGYDVVVVDSRDIALGSTSASTALLQYEVDVDLIDLTHLIGEERATLAYRSGIASIERIENLCKTVGGSAHFERRGSLYLASDDSHVTRLEREFEARRTGGLEVTWLNRDESVAQFNCSRPAAILSKEGAQLDPFQLTRGLLSRARERRTQVYGTTKIASIDDHAGKMRLKTSCGHTITASDVIVCCGYESLPFLPMTVAELHCTYAVVTEPLDSRTHPIDKALIWETARPYLYMRGTPDRRLIMGGQDLPFHSPNLRDSFISIKTAKIRREYEALFRERMPAIAYSWAGTFAQTRDGLPYIGHAPGTHPRLQFALCFGGNGITFSAHAGEMVRAAIESRPHPLQEVFGFRRLTHS